MSGRCCQSRLDDLAITSVVACAWLAAGCSAPPDEGGDARGERGIALLEAPRIVASSDVFVDPIAIRIESEPGLVLRYTLDGREPTIVDARYDGLLRIDDSAVLRTRAFRDGFVVSESAERRFRRVESMEGHEEPDGDSHD